MIPVHKYQATPYISLFFCSGLRVFQSLCSCFFIYFLALFLYQLPLFDILWKRRTGAIPHGLLRNRRLPFPSHPSTPVTFPCPAGSSSCCSQSLYLFPWQCHREHPLPQPQLQLHPSPFHFRGLSFSELPEHRAEILDRHPALPSQGRAPAAGILSGILSGF